MDGKFKIHYIHKHIYVNDRSVSTYYFNKIFKMLKCFDLRKKILTCFFRKNFTSEIR